MTIFLTLLWGGDIIRAADIDRDALVDSYQRLQHQADGLRAKGKLDIYARMRLRLVAQFLKYLKSDIKTHPKDLAVFAARDLKRIIEDESTRLAAIAAGRLTPMDSPRRVPYQYPRIVGRHLEQPVRWADGTIETRPIFLFGFGHNYLMRRDIDLLASLGVNYGQSEFYMPAIMPAQGRWDDGSVKQLRSYIARAGRQGVLTDILLSPHYMPNWVFKLHPDWATNLGGFLRYPINQPKVRKLIGGFIEKAVGELAPDPNFWSCCLLNEPVFFFWGSDPDTRRMWRNWLIGNYGNIAKLNETWGTDYHSWLEVPVYNNPNDDNYITPPGSYDWMRFNDERIANFTEWLGKQVHAVAPNKLTHAKLIERSYRPYDIMQGIDPGLIPLRTDLAGTDSPNPDTYSMLKTVSQHPLINSENHFFGDGSTDDKPRGFTRSRLWLRALAGLDGSAAWIWGRKNSPHFIGQWCFRPGQTEEYLRTGLDLMRLMPDIVALREAPTPVAVLYSRTSVLRNTDHAKILARATRTLRENGIKYSVVTEQMVSSGQVQHVLRASKVIILPGCTNLPTETTDGVAWLVNNEHRRCITIGDNVGTLNAYNRPAAKLKFHTVNIPDAKNDDFDATLVAELGKAGVPHSFRLLDAANMKPVKGIVYQTAQQNGKILATAVNTSDKTINCVWVDKQKHPLTFTDKLDLRASPPSSKLSLLPNQVICGTLRAVGK